MLTFSLLICASDRIPTVNKQNEIHFQVNKNKLLIMINIVIWILMHWLLHFLIQAHIWLCKVCFSMFILKPSIANNIKGKSIVCLNTYNGLVLLTTPNLLYLKKEI